MRPLAAALVLALAVAGASALPENQIELDSGIIEGVVEDGYRAFRGIPYAQPPVGNLRWQNPEPVAPWDGVLDAYSDQPGCPQDCDFPPGTHACPNVTNEDCLYLTLYTPRLAELQNNPAPVMVFYHGGEFINGHGGGGLWNGIAMASMTGTILVGVNYRLGALAWLWNGADIRGNYGIRDQVLALEWVQRNAKAFGGDPTRVTIFGQSAGAISASILMSSPIARDRGLWSRVLMESQPYTIPLRDPTTMPALTAQFAQFLGCALNDKPCLLGKNSSEIVAAQMAAQNSIKSDPKILNAFLCWTPIVDGVVVVEQPFTGLLAGNYDKSIPVVMGTTAQEAFLFIWGAFSKPVPALEYDAALVLILGADVGLQALLQYPAPPGTNDTRPLLATVATQYIFHCANRNVTRGMISYTPDASNVWLYDFNHLCSFKSSWTPNTQCYTAICHGADLPFVFNSFEAYVNYTADEAVLGAAMVTYWTNFGHTGDPSQSGPWNRYAGLQGLQWPSYTVAASPVMSFETPQNRIAANFQQQKCDFWDRMGYGYPTASVSAADKEWVSAFHS